MTTNKMSKTVSDQLINLILSDVNYKPNTKLPNEKELCTMFGVSRQVIRESLKILVAQGYLVTMHGSGSYVAENPGILEDPLGIYHQNIEDSIELLSDWYTARRAIECEVIKLSVRHASQEELNQIAEKCDRFNFYRKNKKNTKEAFFADRDFHLAIAKASHNIILERCTLHLLQSFYYNLVNSTTYVISHSLLKEADNHHQRIVSFLLDRDEDGAIMAIRSHMNHALKILKYDMKNL